MRAIPGPMSMVIAGGTVREGPRDRRFLDEGRMQECGRLADDTCPMCGQHTGTVLHRIWECAETQPERNEITNHVRPTMPDPCEMHQRLRQAGGKVAQFARIADTRGNNPDLIADWQQSAPEVRHPGELATVALVPLSLPRFDCRGLVGFDCSWLRRATSRGHRRRIIVVLRVVDLIDGCP